MGKKNACNLNLLLSKSFPMLLPINKAQRLNGSTAQRLNGSTAQLGAEAYCGAFTRIDDTSCRLKRRSACMAKPTRPFGLWSVAISKTRFQASGLATHSRSFSMKGDTLVVTIEASHLTAKVPSFLAGVVAAPSPLPMCRTAPRRATFPAAMAQPTPEKATRHRFYSKRASRSFSGGSSTPNYTDTTLLPATPAQVEIPRHLSCGQFTVGLWSLETGITVDG